MNPNFRDMLSAFAAEDVEFLVVGAFALAAHGRPRATGDLDLWVRPSADNAERVWKALARFGAPLEGIAPADFARADTVFQVGVAPQRIVILTSLTAVEFAEAWRDRLVVELDQMRVPCLGREHLIRNKRSLGRPRDLGDVADLEGMGEPDDAGA